MSVSDLVVITPSRGRPVQAARLAAAIRETTLGRVDLMLMVDDDDPYRSAYIQLARAGVYVAVAERAGLVGSTNLAARGILSNSQTSPTYLASLGDDHLPRTPDWDLRLIKAIEAMDGPGWAYGNDLLQGERLPTAWVQHRATVELLGWMMLPTLGHMYPDNVVYDVANPTGRLAYVPGVVIEHLHPSAGKAETDESYAESNAPGQYRTDRAAYVAWQQTRMHHDRDAISRLGWVGASC